VHDGSGLKAFTASNLSTGRWGGLITLRPRERYSLRFTTLFPDLTTFSLNALAPAWLRRGLTLHDQPAPVEADALTVSLSWGQYKMLERQGLAWPADEERLFIAAVPYDAHTGLQLEHDEET